MKRGYRARLSLFLAALALAGVFYYASERIERGLVLHATAFEDLPGWAGDDPGGALAAFLRSCRVLAERPADTPVRLGDRAFTIGDLQRICAAVPEKGDAPAARRFFENHFQAHMLSYDGTRTGLLTGYYEPLLHGSFEQSERYSIPLYRRPPEVVTVDLGAFRPELEGRRIAGAVRDGRLHPLPTRGQIVSGAYAGRGLELLWVDDPVDAFFLQIQGSGRVRLPDGGTVRVGYAGPNGHPYTAIGRILVERGALTAEEVSMQTIRRWLAAHPEQARAVMARNASYVFFRILQGQGPIGSQGVVLTAGRSLAVDASRMPLGLPVFVAGSHPDPADPEQSRRLERLMVAQDTGGAITGALRADVFWGFGETAAAIAGHMRHDGRFWVLLPRSARRIDETTEAA